jgi:hypothetical protein
MFEKLLFIKIVQCFIKWATLILRCCFFGITGRIQYSYEIKKPSDFRVAFLFYTTLQLATRIIARHEAIFDRKVGDPHVDDCHAALAMTCGKQLLKFYIMQHPIPFSRHIAKD